MFDKILFFKYRRRQIKATETSEIIYSFIHTKNIHHPFIHPFIYSFILTYFIYQLFSTSQPFENEHSLICLVHIVSFQMSTIIYVHLDTKSTHEIL